MKANISEYSEEWKKGLGLITTPKKKIKNKLMNVSAIFGLHVTI